MNEIGLVVDVKHRKTVPHTIGMMDSVTRVGPLYRVSLENLVKYSGQEPDDEYNMPYAKKAFEFWQHMDEWTQDYMPDGITAIVLHRPYMWLRQSHVLVHSKDWRTLHERIIDPNARTKHRADGAGRITKSAA